MMCGKSHTVEIMHIPKDYKNISKIAKSNGRKLSDWANRPVGGKKIAAFKERNPDIENPIIVVRGKGKQQGTWAHPELAAIFAVWCDPSFPGFQQKIISIAESNTRVESALTDRQESAIKMGLHRKLFGSRTIGAIGNSRKLNAIDPDETRGGVEELYIELFFKYESLNHVLDVVDRYQPSGKGGQLVVRPSDAIESVIRECELTLTQESALTIDRVASTKYCIEYGGKKKEFDIPVLKNQSDWINFVTTVDRENMAMGIPQ